MFFKYLLANKILSLVGIYMIASVLIAAIFSLDISIPCLWKLLFDFHCPGCGLTTAAISLVKLDVQGAYLANPLIFGLVPAGIIFLRKDYVKWYRKYT